MFKFNLLYVFFFSNFFFSTLVHSSESCINLFSDGIAEPGQNPFDRSNDEPTFNSFSKSSLLPSIEAELLKKVSAASPEWLPLVLRIYLSDRYNMRIAAGENTRVLSKYLKDNFVFFGKKTSEIVALIVWGSTNGNFTSMAKYSLAEKLPKLLLLHDNLRSSGADGKALEAIEKLISLLPDILIQFKYRHFSQFQSLIGEISLTDSPSVALRKGIERYIVAEFTSPFLWEARTFTSSELNEQVEGVLQRLATCKQCDGILDVRSILDVKNIEKPSQVVYSRPDLGRMETSPVANRNRSQVVFLRHARGLVEKAMQEPRVYALLIEKGQVRLTRNREVTDWSNLEPVKLEEILEKRSRVYELTGYDYEHFPWGTGEFTPDLKSVTWFLSHRSSPSPYKPRRPESSTTSYERYVQDDLETGANGMLLDHKLREVRFAEYIYRVTLLRRKPLSWLDRFKAFLNPELVQISTNSINGLVAVADAFPNRYFRGGSDRRWIKVSGRLSIQPDQNVEGGNQGVLSVTPHPDQQYVFEESKIERIILGDDRYRHLVNRHTALVHGLNHTRLRLYETVDVATSVPK